MEELEIKNKLFILPIAIFLLLLISFIGSAAEITVEPGNSIQTAVDSASPYDEIIIKPGTYIENVNITKGNLTIRSESGNPDDTIIHAKRSAANVLLVYEANNVAIRGIKATGSGSSYSGIYLYKCSDCTLENNKLTNNGYGIRLTSSSKCSVSKNTVMDNGVYGIEVGSSRNNTISDNTVYNSSRGIYLGSADYNTISGNKVTYNNYLGFYECSLCDYNTVYNNYFNNTDVTVKKGSGNSYNITKTAGTNIIGGSYIGGNYWGKPDGKGFSDTAVDSDGDGIADSAYSLPGDSSYKDYLPLVSSSNSAAPTIPVADFSSSITSGNAPLDVLFTDKSTGTPTSWNWDFGDGTNSQDQNPIHTYTSAGNYNVTLKVNNANGETSKTGTITVLQNSELPVADFGTNATQGSAPLAIQFTDLSQKAVSWNWDFGDSSSSTDQNPVHVYENPGDYNVNLTVSNENGTASKTLGIKVLEAEKEGFPVADFSTSATGGYAPLSVTFTDLSQNAASISWDVNGDGIEDSNASSFTYEYASAGTYTAKLTAINANGTSEKTTTIDVDDEDDEGSSHSSGSSGGGGGGGGSPEPAKNVEVKEISQVFVTNGKPIQFDFTKNATCVVYVGFDSRKTFGKTTTIAEQLKSKSTLTSNLTEGEVYKYFNVWVGNSGFASSENIENPVICFKVEKSWLQDNNIDQDSITLNRYSDETWEQMPASLLNEDSKYLYFTADVSGYSFFAITGKAVQQVDTEGTQIAAEERSVGEIQSEGNDTQEPESDEDNSEIILMGLIAIVALAVIGIVLKSVKK